ncbi:MAG: IMP cyclohydrolase, partial [Lentisphaeria bacterium]|nr:IMP cyclohydrolase [Lentisphaeria bacterium]
MTEQKLSRSTYLNKNIGDFADTTSINGVTFEKVDDLRYGTNPHQPAAYYKIAGATSPIGEMTILKNGKNGLS